MHDQATAVNNVSVGLFYALQVIHLDVKSKVSSEWQPLERLHECEEA